jgi:hypothetical protein
MKLNKVESAIIIAIKAMLEPFTQKSAILFHLWGVVACIQNNDRSSINYHKERLFLEDDARRTDSVAWKDE